MAALGSTTPTDCAGSRDSAPGTDGSGVLGGTAVPAVPAVTADPGGDLASLAAAEAAGRVDRFHG